MSRVTRLIRFVAGASLLAGMAVTGFAQTLDHFDFSTISTPRTAYVPFRIIITAKSSTGATVRTFASTVQLTANSANGPLPVEAFAPLKFTSGQWVGNVSVNEAGTDVTLVCNGGRIGTSAVFQVEPANFRVVESMPIISMASDRVRGLLYASIGPVAGFVGGIRVIDPTSGNVLDTQFIEGGVGRIEISADASKLYVVTDDEAKVRRLRLPDFAEETVLDLGEWEPGALNRADDLAVHPTDPNTIAITKKRRELSPRFTGVSVFEDTVEKKKGGIFVAEANAVAWGAQSNRLYGLDNETSPSEFIQYDVTPTEVSIGASRRNILEPFNGQIEFAGGKVFCTTGRIIDPETFAIYGELVNGSPDALMLAYPEKKRVVYFTPNSLGFMLTYDLDTLQLVGSDPFPAPRGANSGVVTWGENGIAFHDGERLFLTENRYIPTGPAADLAVTAPISQGESLPVGVDQEMSAAVKNLGPNESGPIHVKVTGPVDAVLTGGRVVGVDAQTKVSAREIVFELPSLAADQQVELKFTAHSNVEAWEPFSVVATATGFDANSSNNAVGIILKAAPLPTLAKPTLIRFSNAGTAIDRTRGVIYVSPPTGSAPWANSVIAINPNTGEITPPVLVGQRPAKMAVSDDGKYLYVALQGVPEVRRFLLPGLQHDLTISTGADGFSGPWFAGQIDVRPGISTDIAVTRYNGVDLNASPVTFGFYRNGVEAPPDRSWPEAVRFIGPDRIYAHENSWGIFQFDISEPGLTMTRILRDVEKDGGYDFVHRAGKLYVADGKVYDADAGTNTGTFFTFGPYITPPYVDQSGGRAIFLQRTTTNYMAIAFDLNNYAQIASNNVPIAPIMFGTLNNFDRWSNDGMYFSGSAGIGLFKTDLLAAPPAEVRVESATFNGSTLTLRFSNLSPGQYIIEQCNDLGATWGPLGNSFTETTTEIPIPTTDARKFYRLVKKQAL